MHSVKRHHFLIFISADFGINSLIMEYGLKGRSIHFNIIDTNQSVNVRWRRSDEISTRQFIADIHGVSPYYKEKVRINSDKSLTIKNLQKNDSGTYNALTNWEDQILAEFRLTVESKLKAFFLIYLQRDGTFIKLFNCGQIFVVCCLFILSNTNLKQISFIYCDMFHFSAGFVVTLLLTYPGLNSSQMQSPNPQSWVMILIWPLEGVRPQWIVQLMEVGPLITVPKISVHKYSLTLKSLQLPLTSLLLHWATDMFNVWPKITWAPTNPQLQSCVSINA